MTSSTPKSAFMRGFRAGTPFILMVVPFALVFGVIATEAGLDIAQAMGLSILVIAGASQLTAIQLLSDGAPALVAVITALAVNLRMAMYSASLAVHLGALPFWKRAVVAYLNIDQSFALATAEFETRPETRIGEKFAFFVGSVTPIIPLWYAMTYVGARFGAEIPAEFALDFTVPIAFLAMVTPMLRTLAHVAAALTSVVLALCLVWVPAGLGLLLAAGIAMMVGARVEIWMERQS